MEPLIDLSDRHDPDDDDEEEQQQESAFNHRTTPPKIFDRYLFSSPSSSSSSAAASSDEESDKSNNNSSATIMETTNKRLDNMIQFLDRKLSSSPSSSSTTIPNDIIIPNASSSSYNRYHLDSTNNNNINTASNDNKSSSSTNASPTAGGLPEFIGKGGDSGIFRMPVRKALHPDRPPSLELRPHPFRESQIGCFLRTIIATRSQLWSGREDGSLHVWQFTDLYRGSEETAPFKQSTAVGSSVLCMAGDEASLVVWTGHRDGKIRCWKLMMDVSSHSNSHRFREVLSWIAHRGPVLSMVLTSYGLSLLYVLPDSAFFLLLSFLSFFSFSFCCFLFCDYK